MHLEIYLCSVINGAVSEVLSETVTFKKIIQLENPPSKKIIYKNFFH
jgi:hypothetical protein